MMSVCRRDRILPVLLCLVFFSFGRQTAWAQPASVAEPRPVLQPIGLITLASVERGLNEISQVFKHAGRSDMIDVIDGFLAGEAIRNLPGVDRTRPMGVMFFLGSSLPPSPIPVFYVPIEDEAVYIDALKRVGVTFTREEEGAYDLGTSKENSSQLRIRDGYALLCAQSGSTLLDDEKIPDPAVLTQKFAARYDLSASLNLRGIPPLMKQVFATFFTQQSAARMQQRDHESDAAYQVRRASGLSTLQWIEQLIRDGEEVVIGVDSTEDGSRAVLEVSIDAAENSEFAKCLTGIAGAPSIFTPLVREKHPLQLSMSWNADPREKTALNGYLEAIRLELHSKLPESGHGSIDRLIQTFQSTVNAGHIDAIVQFIPYREREFVLLVGVKVIGGQALAGDLREVWRLISESSSKVVIDFDLHQHEQTSFSRLRSVSSNADSARVFGKRPDLYLGVGSNILWLGLGGDGTLPTLDAAIDALSAPRTSEGTVTSAPFQAIFRAVPWLRITETEKEGRRNQERRELIESAMKPEDDALRMEVRPSDSGVRVTLRFDEGFVRLLGQALAEAYDRSQL